MEQLDSISEIKRNILTDYRTIVLKRYLFISIISLLLILSCFIGCWTGPLKFTFREILYALCKGIFSSKLNISEDAFRIIFYIRFPRVILAIITGAGLALAGMQMQVVLRNPLASPFTLGVSAGAALGAGLAILSGISFVGGKYMVILNAFIFALIPNIVIVLLSSKGSLRGPGMLILAGVAMNFFFSSISTLLTYFSNSEELKALSIWMMGNLGRANWKDIGILSSVIIVVMPLLFLQSHKLNIMNNSYDSARGIGVNVEKTRIIILVLTAFLTASIICFTGVIGFVGIVAPHIVRLIIGNDARYLAPASALFGAFFLLGSDIIAQKIIEPSVLPVGIITSFTGGPLLLFLIIKNRVSKVW